MRSLQEWLKPQRELTEEIKVTNYYPPFVIKAITQEESARLMKKFTKRDKKGNREFDSEGYTAELTVTAVVKPDLTNAELQAYHKTLGASATLQKMLLAGEYANLSLAVQRLSGLDTDINDDIEEVKNA